MDYFSVDKVLVGVVIWVVVYYFWDLWVYLILIPFKAIAAVRKYIYEKLGINQKR